jgi:hypothetical protein
MKKLAILGAIVGTLAVVTAAGAHSTVKVSRPLRITHLFSTPGQKHPKPTPPPKPIINCQTSDGGAYRVCCIWNPDESPYLPGVGVLPIVGAWDCTSVFANRLSR